MKYYYEDTFDESVICKANKQILFLTKGDLVKIGYNLYEVVYKYLKIKDKIWFVGCKEL